MKMFADDTKLYRGVSKTSDMQTLQNDLDALLQRADRWQLLAPLQSREMQLSSFGSSQ